tara:strand:+ start:886 stop:1920 length:1035 start_codon:yes stop_codon:yes gene_type:complete
MDNDTGEGQTPQDFNVSDADTDALRDALGTTEQVGGNADQPEAEEAASATEAQTEGQGELPDQTGEPYAEAEPADQTESERLAKRRIRPRNELDQQVIDLYRSEGFGGTFAEASDVIYGRYTQQAAPVQSNEDTDPVNPYAEHDERAESLSTEITELESKITEATDNLDTTSAMNLQRELFRKELDLSNVKAEKERLIEDSNRSAIETQRQRALESRDRAMQSYPELGDTNSVYRKEFDAYISKAEQDQDYAAVFQSSRWPEILANEFAAIKGYRAVATAPAPTPPPQQAPQLGNQAKVLTSGTTAQPANQPVTASQVVGGIPEMNRDQLYAALGAGDGKRVLR